MLVGGGQEGSGRCKVMRIALIIGRGWLEGRRDGDYVV